MSVAIPTEEIQTEDGTLLLRSVEVVDEEETDAPTIFHLVAWKEQPGRWINILALDSPDTARLDSMIHDPEGQRMLVRLALFMGHDWSVFESDPYGFMNMTLPLIESMTPKCTFEVLGADISDLLVKRAASDLILATDLAIEGRTGLN